MMLATWWPAFMAEGINKGTDDDGYWERAYAGYSEDPPEIRKDPFKYTTFPSKDERRYLNQVTTDLISTVVDRLRSTGYSPHLKNSRKSSLFSLFENMTTEEKILANQLSRLLYRSPIFILGADGKRIKRGDVVAVLMADDSLDREHLVINFSSYVPYIGKTPPEGVFIDDEGEERVRIAMLSKGINDGVILHDLNSLNDLQNKLHSSVVVLDMGESGESNEDDKDDDYNYDEQDDDIPFG